MGRLGEGARRDRPDLPFRALAPPRRRSPGRPPGRREEVGEAASVGLLEPLGQGRSQLFAERPLQLCAQSLLKRALAGFVAQLESAVVGAVVV